MQTIVDRTTPPTLHPFGSFGLPAAEVITLESGIPLYVINMGGQEVSRIDVMFSAGISDEATPLAADTCNRMLKEGFEGMNSAQIAEELDTIGAWLQPYVSRHNSYITLYAMNRFFDRAVKVLEGMIKCPTFPQEEFERIVMRNKQQFIQSLERVENLAALNFNRYYFGADHPYGKVVEQQHYDTLTSEQLRQYFAHYYTANRCKIIITGCVTPSMIEVMNRTFGRGIPQGDRPTATPPQPHSLPTERELYIPKEGALQSAIRMAIPTIDRSHPDYNQLRVVNALFGGYFGSRLMSNIREEKGYTYGIGSSIASLPLAAYLMVSTQTATAHTRPLIAEVELEARRLGNEVVSQEELEVVVNYLSGDLARSFDGAFSIADAYISLLANDLDFGYYERQLRDIQSITPARVQQLAQQYLKAEQFYTVIAG